MNAILSLVAPIIAKVIEALLPVVSSEFRTEMTTLAQGLQAKAKSTGNPWDQVLSNLIAEVFNVPQS